MAPLRV